MNPKLLLMDNGEVLDVIVDVCADHFDAESLSPDAIVSKTGKHDPAMRLVGWSREHEGWICNDVKQGEMVVVGERLVDPYMVRRVVALMYYRRHSQFRWETMPYSLERLQALEAEVLERLGIGGVVATEPLS